MNVEEVRNYCLLMPGVQETFPFGDTTSVMKTGEKIFALINLEGTPSINLKCDPIKALDLRESYTSITPGYHMNKRHWNTIRLDGSLPKELIRSMIDHSYDLIVKSLPKSKRDEL